MAITGAKMMKRAKQLLGITIAALAVGVANIPTEAAAVTIGTSIAGDPVFGQWVSPVFVGSLLDGKTGAVFPPGVVNTSGTAVYGLGSASPSSSTTIFWGSNPSPGTAPPSSSITFTGNPSIPATKGTANFPIGSFSFTNGTSINGSEIFGATLALYAKAITGNIPIGSIAFTFTATVNDGTAPQNADYLNVAGIKSSFNVLEGATTSASLFGTIVGDPIFVPQFFQLDPNQTGGFIGNSPPAPNTPLPASWVMMLTGLGAISLACYRRSKMQVAAHIT
jgi:hypothetical protein